MFDALFENQILWSTFCYKAQYSPDSDPLY